MGRNIRDQHGVHSFHTFLYLFNSHFIVNHVHYMIFVLYPINLPVKTMFSVSIDLQNPQGREGLSIDVDHGNQEDTEDCGLYKKQQAIPAEKILKKAKLARDGHGKEYLDKIYGKGGQHAGSHKGCLAINADSVSPDELTDQEKQYRIDANGHTNVAVAQQMPGLIVFPNELKPDGE